MQLDRRQRELGLECAGLNDRAARAGSAGSKKLAERSLARVFLDDAALAGEVFTDGAGKDFDSLLREAEVGRTNHHARYIFDASWYAALLHNGVRAGFIDLGRDGREAFVAGEAADVFVPHEVNRAVGAGAIGEDGAPQIAQDFVDGVAAAASDAEHRGEQVSLAFGGAVGFLASFVPQIARTECARGNIGQDVALFDVG